MSDTIYDNDDGIKACLDSITGKAATPMGGGKLRLFKNNVTVDKTTVIGGLTEATFNGYAAITLTSATWAAATQAAHVASSSYGASPQFTCTGGGASQTVYGWYLTDAAGTKLYACANFATGPYVMVNNGDSITVNPLTLTYQSLN